MCYRMRRGRRRRDSGAVAGVITVRRWWWCGVRRSPGPRATQPQFARPRSGNVHWHLGVRRGRIHRCVAGGLSHLRDQRHPMDTGDITSSIVSNAGSSSSDPPTLWSTDMMQSARTPQAHTTTNGAAALHLGAFAVSEREPVGPLQSPATTPPELPPRDATRDAPAGVACECDSIVNDYLRRLAIAVSRFSVARPSETIKEIAATVYGELSRLPVVSPTAVVDLFERIGQPEHLAKRAAGTSRPDIEAQRRRVIVRVALAMVVVGAISCVGALALGMSGARHSGHHHMLPTAFAPAGDVRRAAADSPLVSRDLCPLPPGFTPPPPMRDNDVTGSLAVLCK